MNIQAAMAAIKTMVEVLLVIEWLIRQKGVHSADGIPDSIEDDDDDCRKRGNKNLGRIIYDH